MIGHHKLRDAARAKSVENGTDRALRIVLGRKHRFLLMVYPPEAGGDEIALVTNTPELASPSGLALVLRALPADPVITIQGDSPGSIDKLVDLAIHVATGQEHIFLLVVLPIWEEHGGVTLYSNSPEFRDPEVMSNVRRTLETGANAKPPQH